MNRSRLKGGRLADVSGLPLATVKLQSADYIVPGWRYVQAGGLQGDAIDPDSSPGGLLGIGGLAGLPHHYGVYPSPHHYVRLLVQPLPAGVLDPDHHRLDLAVDQPILSGFLQGVGEDKVLIHLPSRVDQLPHPGVGFPVLDLEERLPVGLGPANR